MINKTDRTIIVVGFLFGLYGITVVLKHRQTGTRFQYFKYFVTFLVFLCFLARLLIYSYYKLTHQDHLNSGSMYNRFDRSMVFIMITYNLYSYYSWIVRNKKTLKTSKISKLMFIGMLYFILPAIIFLWKLIKEFFDPEPNQKLILESLDFIRIISINETRLDEQNIKSEFNRYSNLPNMENYTFSLIQNKETSTVAIVYKELNNKELIITFRATAEPEDVKTDINALDLHYDLPITNTDILNEKRVYVMKLHRGFLKAYKSIRESLFATFFNQSNFQQIKVYGHSLGGALSTICAFDLFANLNILPLKNVNSLFIYTYGSPSVGDNNFAIIFNKYIKNSFRIVNGLDPVPIITQAQFSHVNHPYSVYDTSTIPGRYQHSSPSYVRAIQMKQSNKIMEYISYTVVTVIFFILFIGSSAVISDIRKQN